MKDRVHFDEFADTYKATLDKQHRFFAESSDYYAEYKAKIIHENTSCNPQKILEYGCGIGSNIKFIRELFPDTQLFGCDVSHESLKIAGDSCPSCRYFHLYDEKVDEKYSIILAANVFHHIHPSERDRAMAYISRNMESGGELFIFEHNPYNPITRYMVNTCPFDADAILLAPSETELMIKRFPFDIVLSRSILFFPSWLKSLRKLENCMGFLPLGGQYFVKAIKR